VALLSVRDVGVHFGGVVALDGLTFSVSEGAICSLIGPNGAGKTTLFNVLGRLYQPNEGMVTFDGKNLLAVPSHRIAQLGIARTFQNVALFPALTVLENVMTGAHSSGHIGFVAAALRIGAGREERRMRTECMALLERLGLADLAARPCAGLPYGTLKRIEIARALASSPKLLLLDEPAAWLTHGEVDGLGDDIRQLRDDFSLSVLLVEHHMAMVMRISDEVVVMDFGRKIAEGTPDEVRNDKAVIAAYLGTPAS
jgi:branched-chain amino acid transport system ATP-binding protein